MSSLDAFGVNYDGRSDIMPRGLVKANAMVDNDYLKDARSRLKNAPTATRFLGTSLSEANEMFKIYDKQPIVVHRGRAAMMRNTGKQNQPGNRTDAAWETRVPVIGTLNGAAGKNHFDIMSQFALLGLADQPDRLGQSSALNAIMGGQLTVPNGPKAMVAGDYVLVSAPDPDNLSTFPTRAVAGNMADKLGPGGRVPFYFLPFRVADFNWYNGKAIERVINSYYEEVTPAKVTTKLWMKRVKPAPADFIAASFAKAVDQQVKSLTQLVQLSRSITKLDPAVYAPKNKTNANEELDVRAPGVAPDALIDEKIALDTAIRIMLGSGRPHVTAGKESWIGTNLAGRDALAKNVFAIMQQNPFEGAMRAQAQFRLTLEEWVIGRAVVGAAPYNDFDIHLRAYGR